MGVVSCPEAGRSASTARKSSRPRSPSSETPSASGPLFVPAPLFFFLSLAPFHLLSPLCSALARRSTGRKRAGGRVCLASSSWAVSCLRQPPCWPPSRWPWRAPNWRGTPSPVSPAAHTAARAGFGERALRHCDSHSALPHRVKRRRCRRRPLPGGTAQLLLGCGVTAFFTSWTGYVVIAELSALTHQLLGQVRGRKRGALGSWARYVGASGGL